MLDTFCPFMVNLAKEDRDEKSKGCYYPSNLILHSPVGTTIWKWRIDISVDLPRLQRRLSRAPDVNQKH